MDARPDGGAPQTSGPAGKRLILRVRWGPMAYARAVVEPGGVLRVGRLASHADFVVPHDRQMAKVHFELSWDGARCLLRDRAGVAGTDLTAPTKLNGESVSDQAEVRNGAYLGAGETIFSVYVEEATPVRPEDEMGAETTPTKARALAALEAEPEPLFAVLDAGRCRRVAEVLRESVEEHRSLYEGIKGEALAEVAPYLVSLPRACRLLPRLVREGWGKRWGIYLTSSRPFSEVRSHLRRFLRIVDEVSQKPLYFRFYDPGVLRVFLPTCTVRQRSDFLGELGGYVAEGETGEVLRFGAAPATRTSPAPPGMI